VADFIPCELCWFQRIAMYPMVIVLFVSAWRGDVRAGVQYTFLFPIVGILISAYHIYIEENPSAEPKACSVGGASCVVKWIDKFGYITIPVLAATAFAAIITLLAMAWSRRRPAAAPLRD
jgi:disulfide bond formation protein DsbB